MSSKQLELIGGITYLAQCSPVHLRYTVGLLVHRIGRSIESGQFIYWVSEERGPVAFCAWTYLSDPVLQDVFDTGREILKEEMNQGKNLFFTEMIAPFGHLKRFIRDLRDNKEALFGSKDVTAYGLRVKIAGLDSEACSYRKTRYKA